MDIYLKNTSSIYTRKSERRVSERRLLNSHLRYDTKKKREKEESAPFPSSIQHKPPLLLLVRSQLLYEPPSSQATDPVSFMVITMAHVGEPQLLKKKLTPSPSFFLSLPLLGLFFSRSSFLVFLLLLHSSLIHSDFHLLSIYIGSYLPIYPGSIYLSSIYLPLIFKQRSTYLSVEWWSFLFDLLVLTIWG